MAAQARHPRISLDDLLAMAAAPPPPGPGAGSGQIYGGLLARSRGEGGGTRASSTTVPVRDTARSSVAARNQTVARGGRGRGRGRGHGGGSRGRAASRPTGRAAGSPARPLMPAPVVDEVPPLAPLLAARPRRRAEAVPVSPPLRAVKAVKPRSAPPASPPRRTPDDTPRSPARAAPRSPAARSSQQSPIAAGRSPALGSPQPLPPPPAAVPASWQPSPKAARGSQALQSPQRSPPPPSPVLRPRSPKVADQTQQQSPQRIRPATAHSNTPVVASPSRRSPRGTATLCNEALSPPVRRHSDASTPRAALKRPAAALAASPSPSPLRRKDALPGDEVVSRQLVAASAKRSKKVPRSPATALVANPATSPRTPRVDTVELRGLDLVEVPLEALTGEKNTVGSPEEGTRRSSRKSIRPLQTWRNERVVYERLAGSPTPSVKCVMLNAATDMESYSQFVALRSAELQAQQPGVLMAADAADLEE